MTERKKRKIYSPEFKAKVGIEALKGLKTVNEIGRRMGSTSARTRVLESKFQGRRSASATGCGIFRHMWPKYPAPCGQNAKQ